MYKSFRTIASIGRPLLASSITLLVLLSAASPAADTTTTPAEGSTADADASGLDGQLATVTVTARNRSESAQDVPIPMSVLQSSDLVRDNTLSIQDLTQKAPGLEATTPNSRRTGISMRGIGKSAGNDALEASVGVLVDGIFLSHPGMTYQDFTDLDQVEVLRGPQGTLLGKNTTIGAVSFTSKSPSFTQEGSATFTAGERNAHTANAAFSNSLIDDLLAYRVSAFVDKQDGFISNVDSEGGTTNERNRSGARLQLLLTPFTMTMQRNRRASPRPAVWVLPRRRGRWHYKTPVLIPTPAFSTAPTSAATNPSSVPGTGKISISTCR